MIREEVITTIKAILKEISESEDAVCYLNSEDITWLSMVIKALKQEPCEDCISREQAKVAIRDRFKDLPSRVEINTILNELPSVTPQPKIGHWILADEQNKEDVENDNYRFICSECQCSDVHAKGTKVPYCWKCGSKMESEL